MLNAVTFYVLIYLCYARRVHNISSIFASSSSLVMVMVDACESIYVSLRPLLAHLALQKARYSQHQITKSNIIGSYNKMVLRKHLEEGGGCQHKNHVYTYTNRVTKPYSVASCVCVCTVCKWQRERARERVEEIGLADVY